MAKVLLLEEHNAGEPLLMQIPNCLAFECKNTDFLAGFHIRDDICNVKLSIQSNVAFSYGVFILVLRLIYHHNYDTPQCLVNTIIVAN